MLEVGDIDDMFIPSPDDLLVNLDEQTHLIEDLLKSLPETHSGTYSTQSALGAALQAAYKLLVNWSCKNVILFSCFILLVLNIINLKV